MFTTSKSHISVPSPPSTPRFVILQLSPIPLHFFRCLLHCIDVDMSAVAVYLFENARLGACGPEYLVHVLVCMIELISTALNHYLTPMFVEQDLANGHGNINNSRNK